VLGYRYALVILSKNQLLFSKHGTDRLIRLKLPSLLEYRDLAMRMVTAACKLVRPCKVHRATGRSRFDPEFDDHVISAFGEAFNNAALHSYADGAIGDLEIEIEPSEDRLTIRLMDYGNGFDFNAVAKPDLDSLPESGLGIFIMRSCMDDVTYVAGKPNVLSLTKYLVRDDDGTGDSAAGE
jgi:serine/threonine-protein kinase RsbW